MKKILGEERRNILLAHLKSSSKPLTGADLAKLANVSRQVIVSDINLLKARNEPIISTSQGYLYISKDAKNGVAQRIIVSSHTLEQTKDELFTIVDHGAVVKNVIVEHPVYGEITANLHLSSRLEVEQFMKKISETNAPLLSTLTYGTHLHLIEAPSEEILDLVEQKLSDKGFLHEA